MSSPQPSLSPVATGQRIALLDVLRGFAVLGILVMNIQSYSMPGAAYFFPVAYGNLTGAHYWVWYLSDLLFSQKFMTIFSLLFGAGIVLMHERAQATGRGSAAVHYRRMGVLLLIGLAHAYLFWEGDILVSYALCGLFLWLFRRLRPSRLLISGCLLLLIGSAISCFFGWSTAYWPPESVAEFRAGWQPTPEMLAATIADMQGGWISEFRHRLPELLVIHSFYVPFFVLWRAGGCMLLGMAMYKWGFLTGRSPSRRYFVWIGLAILIGLPVSAFGTIRLFARDWEPVYSFFIGAQYGYWGSIPIALGWISAVVLLYRRGVWSALTGRLAAVGRMALTNYVMQTLICTTLFYGRGLGLFGEVERVGQIGIVFAIWILQLWYSPLWLRRFRFGPAEWLWRSAVYRRWQPLRRLV
jgi:uncharacterized protein